MKNRMILFQTECRKLHRSPILLISVFASVLTAAFVFAADPNRYIGHIGWYMDEVQPWSVFFLLPSITALFGSYLICRETEDDTLKSLRLIPIHPARLNAVKLLLTFLFALALSLLLFTITCLVELFLHGTTLPLPFILRMLRQYLLNGVGVFFAVTPLIAFCAFKKNGQWAALIVTEIYSIGGLFATIADPYRTYYPVAAIFQFSGYYPATWKNRLLSTLILASCGIFTVLFLWLRPKKENIHTTF